MSRRSEEYAKVDVGWPMDPRCRELRTPWKWLYAVMWLTAVKERSEVLPAGFSLDYLAKVAGVTKETAGKFERFCEKKKGNGGKPLVEFLPGGRIRVCGVRGKHHELRLWRDDDRITPKRGEPEPETETDGELKPRVSDAGLTAPQNAGRPLSSSLSEKGLSGAGKPQSGSSGAGRGKLPPRIAAVMEFWDGVWRQARAGPGQPAYIWGAWDTKDIEQLLDRNPLISVLASMHYMLVFDTKESATISRLARKIPEYCNSAGGKKWRMCQEYVREFTAANPRLFRSACG